MRIVSLENPFVARLSIAEVTRGGRKAHALPDGAAKAESVP